MVVAFITEVYEWGINVKYKSKTGFHLTIKPIMIIKPVFNKKGDKRLPVTFDMFNQYSLESIKTLSMKKNLISSTVHYKNIMINPKT